MLFHIMKRCFPANGSIAACKKHGQSLNPQYLCAIRRAQSDSLTEITLPPLSRLARKWSRQ